MINNPNTGYWDYSSANDQVGPQWVDYGDPGSRPAPGPITVGGDGGAANTGTGGMPIGGANPIFTSGTPGSTSPSSGGNPLLSAYGPPASLAPQTQTFGSQFTPTPFMPPGMTFQPHTQFEQQASAPLNINQQGRTYGQMPGGPNMAQQTPAFRSVRPGGSSGFMPQFQNPYGPQLQQPQQYTPMGQPPTQISQQPTQLPFTPVMRPPRPQPTNDGLAALMASQMQNR
jgi:hypothetical protein